MKLKHVRLGDLGPRLGSCPFCREQFMSQNITVAVLPNGTCCCLKCAGKKAKEEAK